MYFVLLFISGILGGLLGGMGMGGGTVLIPMLTLLFKINQKQAQGINLLSFIPMAIVALILHAKNKLIDLKSAIMLSLPALVFSIGGSFLVDFIKSDIQSKLFGGFLVLLAVWQFIATIKGKKDGDNEDKTKTKDSAKKSAN